MIKFLYICCMIKIKANIIPPKYVMEIHRIFINNNYELYLVGGCVRDYILNIKPKDWDLVTNANPDKVIELLKSEKFVSNILETGKQFGVINVITNQGEFEIATMRKDIGHGRRPDSVKFTNIETDILRRDLSFNALFYDIGTKEIVDLVGGIDDIKNGVVRTVGEPKERFGEDRLRILRAIRFAARVGSRLDPSIDKQLKNDSSLEGISTERIRDEFLKGIKSAKSVKFFLDLLFRYSLLNQIFIDIGGFKGINKIHVESHDPILVISCLISNTSYNEASKKLNNLSYSSDEVKKISFLLAFYQTFGKETFYPLKKLHNISNISDSTFIEFAEVFNIDKNIVNKFINFELSVTGPQVQKQFGIEAGPEMGKKIKSLEWELFQDS